MTSMPAINKAHSSAGRLQGDRCERDWIWEREVEAASQDEKAAMASAAWDRQRLHIAEGSEHYSRKLREARIQIAKLRLADIAKLPFSTKDELRRAYEERPPFGTNAGVAPERIKRVYQTSGTTGSPTVIALTRADMETWTTIGARTYHATGIHEHHSVLTTFGAGPFVAGHTHFVLSRIGARSVPVAPGDTARVLFGLKAGLADTLLATPSFAQYLANRFETSHEDPGSLALLHVVTGGEPGGGMRSCRPARTKVRAGMV